ncbi:MAG TPA: hypothetical protein VGR00_03340, partial [Thermoanaerobaculia bacterium]|nr:hypothetical protein [Thermoanaerobaculia bacterium]
MLAGSSLGKALSTAVLVVALYPAASLFADEVKAPAADDPSREAVERGDAAWQARAEGSSGEKASPKSVDAAIAAYREALAKSPDSLEARWRLMRALYFKGEYTTDDIAEKKTIFDEGKKVGEDALAIVRRQAAAASKKSTEKASPVELAPLLAGRRDVLASFFWASVDWGKWALAFGKSAAVKQGAAAKIRDYAAAVIAMDPAFEEAGGYRVLGRLHHQTPAVPFFTGWASRSDALRNLKLAVKTNPRNFINRLYLAEAMWDYEKANREQARAMLEAMIADTPSPDFPVEDRKTQKEARALLALW